MEKKTSRFDALSDGIFAVAITLLALEIGVERRGGLTNRGLWMAIAEQWPTYFAYFNSFATILLIWLGHHRIASFLRSTNHRIILANGAVLMLVGLFPFPTRLVGIYIGTPAESMAVAFYASYAAVIVVSMILFNEAVARSERALSDPVSAVPSLRRLRRGQFIGFAAYVTAAALAWRLPIVALLLTLLVWIWWLISTAVDD